MPKHEFGIMQQMPMTQERFDEYEPQKFDCITMDDALMEPILSDLNQFDCYWHTLQRPEKCLAYFGITLIPPESMEGYLACLTAQCKKEYDVLIALLCKAKEEHKYVIHYGI